MNDTPADSPPPPTRVFLLSADTALPRRIIDTGLVADLQVIGTLAQLDALLPTLKNACLLLTALADQIPLASLIQTLQPRLSRCRIVALDSNDDSENVVACLRAGADDFLSLRDPRQIPLRLARILRNLQPSGLRRHMDRRFKTLADSAPALVWITDHNGAFIHFNRPWLVFTGRDPELEFEQGWIEGIDPEDRDRFSQEFAAHFSRREPFRIDFRLRRHDGLYRWVTCQGVPHYEEDEFFTGYIGSCLDVTEQHEAETLLAYRSISQAALAGFGRFALGQHQIQEIKQEATRLLCDILQLQYSKVLLFDPPESDQLALVCHTGLPADFALAPMNGAAARASQEEQLRLEDDFARFPGRENHAALGVVSALAVPITNGDQTVGFLVGLSTRARVFGREAFDFIRALVTTISTVHQRNLAEITLQKSELKLFQSQKMEAVGQLAGGVAHDFNNLLTAVRCYGDMLHEDLADIAPELRTKTAEILKATDRASALTRQLLAFSRKQVLQPEALDMNMVIVDLRDLMRSLLSESVSLQIDLSRESAYFEADRNQIDQVVLNLCLNARDAMPKGGLLTLHITTVALPAANPHKLPPGDYVQLSVSDTGVGMPPEVQARLFQPFFTTKPVGRGTGLGLATCAVIVKNCNGAITFESTPGRGTRFSVLLPRIDRPQDDFSLEAETQIAVGGERILVVEDDEAIRQIAHAILTSLGYKATVVSGSAEALALFQATPPPTFDLLLTDVIMPEVDGLTLARDIQLNHAPGLRILFMSGYLGDTSTVQAVADYNLPFLEKPFTLDDLARKIREALDSAPVGLPPAPAT